MRKRKMFLSRFIVAMFVIALYACSTEEPKKPTPTDDNNNQSGTEVLTTSIVTYITPTTAKSGGSQINTASGVILSKGIVWNTSASPTIDHFSKLAGEGYAAFVCVMTDLQPNTKYYARAYITNQNGIFYGNEVSFTTYAKISITNNTITLPGYSLTCLVEGGTSLPILERGVLYNTSKQELSEIIGTKIKAETDLIGSFTIQLAQAGVLYALPYVINETGIYYGSNIVTLATSGTFTDSRDGNLYTYVKIGNQIWMAENLKYLPSVVGPSTGSQTTPYYYVYGYNGSEVNEAKATANYLTYGVLYNWTAACNSCPAGGHLPSDAEWAQLTDYLGGTTSIAGGKLKEIGTTHWYSPNNCATNETGFTALPGGGRSSSGNFSYIGYSGYWWSAMEGNTYAWNRGVFYDGSDVVSYVSFKEVGFSVRCVRD